MPDLLESLDLAVPRDPSVLTPPERFMAAFKDLLEALESLNDVVKPKPKREAKQKNTRLIEAISTRLKASSIGTQRKRVLDEYLILQQFPPTNQGHFGTTLQNLILKTKLPSENVKHILSELEEAGRVHHLGDNWFLGPAPTWPGTLKRSL